MLTATVTSSTDTLRQRILVNDRHWLETDEPEDLGGEDTAPTPLELLPAALASCVVTTIRMFARRKGWQLDDSFVEQVMKIRGDRPIKIHTFTLGGTEPSAA